VSEWLRGVVINRGVVMNRCRICGVGMDRFVGMDCGVGMDRFVEMDCGVGIALGSVVL